MWRRAWSRAGRKTRGLEPEKPFFRPVLGRMGADVPVREPLVFYCALAGGSMPKAWRIYSFISSAMASSRFSVPA